MHIIKATHLGMCFGVRDAIALALEHADASPLTILGDLVHNPTVLGALEAKGFAVAQDAAHVATPTVMVTAHGTSARALARTRALGRQAPGAGLRTRGRFLGELRRQRAGVGRRDRTDLRARRDRPGGAGNGHDA